MSNRDQDWYTPQDPNDRPRPQPQPARLWPYVLAGLLCAGLIAYSFDGILERLMQP